MVTLSYYDAPAIILKQGPNLYVSQGHNHWFILYPVRIPNVTIVSYKGAIAKALRPPP